MYYFVVFQSWCDTWTNLELILSFISRRRNLGQISLMVPEDTASWWHSLNSEPDSWPHSSFCCLRLPASSSYSTWSFLKNVRSLGPPTKIGSEFVVEFPHSFHWYILILSYQFCLLNMLILLNTQSQIRYLERLCNKNKCLQRRCFYGKTL